MGLLFSQRISVFPTYSPNPSPASECAPPRFWGEGHTRWREKGWESPNSDEGTSTVVLFKYMYFVPIAKHSRISTRTNLSFHKTFHMIPLKSSNIWRNAHQKSALKFWLNSQNGGKVPLYHSLPYYKFVGSTMRCT